MRTLLYMRYNHNMKAIENEVILLPKNDPEAVLIGKICNSLKIPIVVSEQPHGAYLGAEKNIEERIQQVAPGAKKITIIEIPGPEEEKMLKQNGYQVQIIDHHRYPGLDRMHPESSLEQFLRQFSITKEDLQSAGLNPWLVKGVGVIDRSFVWGLTKEGFSDTLKKEVIGYYQRLLREMYGKERQTQEDLAEKLFKSAVEKNGFLVIDNKERPDIAIRDALSFEIAKHKNEPAPLLLISGTMVYVQESDKAKELYEEFGGFMYGGDERCWGKRLESKEEVEKVKEKLHIP